MDNHAIEVKVTLIENIARNDLDAVIYDLDKQIELLSISGTILLQLLLVFCVVCSIYSG